MGGHASCFFPLCRDLIRIRTHTRHGDRVYASLAQLATDLRENAILLNNNFAPPAPGLKNGSESRRGDGGGRRGSRGGGEREGVLEGRRPSLQPIMKLS